MRSPGHIEPPGLDRRALAATALVLLAALAPGTADAKRIFSLRRLVVVGDSLMAGFTNGGLTETTQRQSPAAMIAGRARVNLSVPTMSSPGVPPPYRIADGNLNGRLDRGEVLRRGLIGFRDHPGDKARNLAVPGESLESITKTIDPLSMAGDIVGGSHVDGRQILKFLILGLPLSSDPVSQVTRARDLNPTFILLWIGGNDVLPMATATDPTKASLSPAGFGTRFRQLLDSLADTHARMAVANLADVSALPALRRAAGDVTGCQAADGTIVAVAADDLLSIDLSPSLLPTPPCTKVLTADERAAVRAQVVAYNTEIAAAVTEVSGARGVGIVLIDVFALFDQLDQTGVDLDGDGSPNLTTRYLGGLFGLDGIHPTRTGNAIIANAFISGINTHFGEAIPPVNVARVAARDPLTRSRFRPAGEPPFGIIRGDGNALEDSFATTGARIESGLKTLGEDIRNALGNLF